VHYVFRDNARDQPNKYIPDQVKHTFPPAFRTPVEYTPRVWRQAEGSWQTDFLISVIRVDQW
jgi:hypothetical protein